MSDKVVRSETIVTVRKSWSFLSWLILQYVMVDETDLFPGVILDIYTSTLVPEVEDNKLVDTYYMFQFNAYSKTPISSVTTLHCDYMVTER